MQINEAFKQVQLLRVKTTIS